MIRWPLTGTSLLVELALIVAGSGIAPAGLSRILAAPGYAVHLALSLVLQPPPPVLDGPAQLEAPPFVERQVGGPVDPRVDPLTQLVQSPGHGPGLETHGGAQGEEVTTADVLPGAIVDGERHRGVTVRVRRGNVVPGVTRHSSGPSVLRAEPVLVGGVTPEHLATVFLRQGH